MTKRSPRSTPQKPVSQQAGFDDRLWPIAFLILGLAGLATYAVGLNSRFPDPATLDITDRAIYRTGWFRLASVAVFVVVAFGVVLCLQRWMSRRVLFCVLLGLLVHLCGAMYLRDQVLAVLTRYRADEVERLAKIPEPIRVPDYHWQNVDRPQVRQSFQVPVRTLGADQHRLETVRKDPIQPTLHVEGPLAVEDSFPGRPRPEPVLPQRTDRQDRPKAEQTAEIELNRRHADLQPQPVGQIALPAIPAAVPEVVDDLEVRIRAARRRQTPAPVPQPEVLLQQSERLQSLQAKTAAEQPMRRLAANRRRESVPELAPLAKLPPTRQSQRVARLRLESAPPLVQVPPAASRPGDFEVQPAAATDATLLELDESARLQRARFTIPADAARSAAGLADVSPLRWPQSATSSPVRGGLVRATVGESAPGLEKHRPVVPIARKRSAMPLISGRLAEDDSPIAPTAQPDAATDRSTEQPDKIEGPEMGRLARRERGPSSGTPVPSHSIPSVDHSLPRLAVAGRESLPRRNVNAGILPLDSGKPIPGPAGRSPLEIQRRRISPVINPRGGVPGGAFGQRDPQGRLELARRYGGDEKTERAVELGLAYFARHQFPDGHWSLNPPPEANLGSDDPATAGRMHADTAATGLALLAFLGAGYTHQDGKYGTTVRSGIEWLVANQQPGGQLYSVRTDSSKFARMYGHGIASIALGEAYGMTADADLREPVRRAIEFIVSAQHRVHGGWRYVPGEESDTSVSGWQLMALKSAQLAGLAVPEEVLQKVSDWLDTARTGDGTRYVYNPHALDTPAQQAGRKPSLAMTAEGLLMQIYLGGGRSDPQTIAAADYLQENLPQQGTSARPLRDAYYWYYGTQVMFQMQGDWWARWNARIRPMLLSGQTQEGTLGGSWDPYHPIPDRWAHAGGRHYITALHLLALEVYYRHLPLFEALGE